LGLVYRKSITGQFIPYNNNEPTFLTIKIAAAEIGCTSLPNSPATVTALYLLLLSLQIKTLHL
jgi:hypothetical protein